VRLLLARHAQTAWSREDRFCGRTEVPLSAVGEAQAERLAARLRDSGAVALYTSPAARALATAAIVGQATGLTPRALPDLREVDFGRWEGLSRAEVRGRDAEAYAAWLVDPTRSPPPDGEPVAAACRRVLDAVERLACEHAGSTVVVIGHRTLNRLLLCALLGATLSRYRRLDQSEACLNVVDVEQGSAVLRLLNDTSHLVTLEEGRREGGS
jgi:probable phosphoglycerate mutase